MREVRTDKERLRACAAFQERKARLARKPGIEIREFAPLRMRDLARVMQGIPRDDHLRAPGFNAHADMTWRMARGRQQGDSGADPVIRGDEIGEAGFDDGEYRIAEARAVIGVLVLRLAPPVVELTLAEDVPGPGECRQPFSLSPACIPADMIEVEVRADDEIDIIGPD